MTDGLTLASCLSFANFLFLFLFSRSPHRARQHRQKVRCSTPRRTSGRRHCFLLIVGPFPRPQPSRPPAPSLRQEQSPRSPPPSPRRHLPSRASAVREAGPHPVQGCVRKPDNGRLDRAKRTGHTAHPCLSCRRFPFPFQASSTGTSARSSAKSSPNGSPKLKRHSATKVRLSRPAVYTVPLGPSLMHAHVFSPRPACSSRVPAAPQAAKV